MSPEEQKRLGAFLRSHDHRSAQAYLGLRAEFEEDTGESALEKRRTWAQAQQTNPKFQDEAIWVLSNLNVLREALAIPAEEMLWLDTTHGHEANRLQEGNLYELLGLSAAATTDQIRDAHRLRYRDARHLKDRHEAHQIYAALDEAWRVLNDPELREAYNTEHALSAGKKFSVPEPASDPALSEKQALTDAPTLRIQGERQLSFEIAHKVIRRKIRIEREGPGLVDATLRSDQNWLSARPERLEPHAASQDIHIQIDPKLLPGQSALGQIVVKNFNGQRLAIHIRVTRRPLKASRLIKGAFGLFILLAALFFMPATRALFFGQAGPPIQAPIIHLQVHPGPATVFVNNNDFAPQTEFILRDLPTNRPFSLRVEKQGFKTYKERVVLSAGQERKITVVLEPESPQGDK
jgi:curved DNA-binding protein CbpA